MVVRDLAVLCLAFGLVGCGEEGDVSLSATCSSSLFFQRAVGTGTRDVSLTGTWSGSNAIEVRWGDDAVAATADPDGTWTATLTGLAAGENVVELHHGGGWVSCARVLVGDIFVISGQSNAEGVQVVPDVHDANADGQAPFTPLSWNPAGWAETGAQWTDSAEKSVWPLVQRGLMDHESVSVPVAFVRKAIAAKKISTWVANGMAGYEVVRDAALLAQGQDFGTYDSADVVRGLLWWQGVRDADEGTTQASYNADLDMLANQLNTDLGAQWMPAKMHSADFDETAVNAAIDEAVADNANVVAGPDLSAIVSDDGKHITDPDKLQDVADLWVSAIVAAWYT